MVSVQLSCDVFLDFPVEFFDLGLVRHFPSPEHDVEVLMRPL